jgi:NAD+ kinase
MEVGIVAQKGNNRAAYLAEDLRDRLREATVRVAVDESTADALGLDGIPVSAMDSVDLVVSIGGDGTFLFAARGAGGVPILGVNLGEVGFLNAVPPDDAVDAVLAEVDAFRGERMRVREAPRLAAACDGWRSEPAANEIVVQGGRRGRGGGVGYEVRVDGSLYSSGHADGVLVATPTGSTAYNLSEGGPLVHPEVDGLVVTEMCAEGGMPPLLVGPDAAVSVTLTDTEEAVVITDGRGQHSLDVPAEVTVASTDPPVRVAGPSSDFFEALGKLA